ncbi:MAG: hypothetical protein ACK4NA_12680 [Alphaproteobacteria bacterium]
MATFNNGQRVRDQITGFKGVIECTVIWINGCVRYGVRSEELKDGKPLDLQYLDEEQLVEDGAAIHLNQKQVGGERQDPPRFSGDRR